MSKFYFFKQPLFSCVLIVVITFLLFSALSYGQSKNDEWDRAGALWQEAERQMNSSNYWGAIEKYEAALSIYQKIGEKRAVIALLTNIGAAYRETGDYQKALSCSEEALNILGNSGDIVSRGNLLGNLGNIYNADFGDFPKAISCYEQAITIFEFSGEKGKMGVAVGNLGSVYSSMGEYQKAISCYKQGIAIAGEVGDKRDKALFLDSLGSVYRKLGDSQKAISFYEQSLAIAEESGDRQVKAYALESLGAVHSDMGEPLKALSFYDQAMIMLGNIGLPYWGAQAGRAHAFLALGKDDQAFTIFQVINSNIDLGCFLLKYKDYQRAIEHFNTQRSRDEERKDTEAILARWIGLGLSHEGLKEFETALAWYTKAIGFMEEQRESLLPSEREHYFEGKVFSLRRIEAYKGAVRCSFMLGKLDDTFYWAENTRGRILSEILSGRQADRNYKIPQKIAEEEDNLIRQIMINKKLQQGAFQKNNQQKLKQYENEYLGLKQQMDALIDRLRKDYPQYAAVKYPRPVKLSQLALKKGETIVEYEVTDPYTIGLVIRDGKIIKGFKVEKTRDELEAMIRKYRAPFQEGLDLNEFRFNSSKDLADLLIKPFMPLLPKGEHLIIVADECLNLLPFEAILIEAPVELLKAESMIPAQETSMAQRDNLNKQAIIRGLSKKSTTPVRGTTLTPRVSANVLFETDSAQISNESKKLMAEIIAALQSKELKSISVRIEGHTDNIGNPAYNLRLSRKRAQAVVNYLVKNGISSGRLSFRGKGDIEPVADNSTEKGRKLNRRVDLVRIVEKPNGKSNVRPVAGLVYVMDEFPVSYYQSASVLTLQRKLDVARVKNQSFFGLGDPVFNAQEQRSAAIRSVTLEKKMAGDVIDITGNEGSKEAGYHFSRLENTSKEVSSVSSLFSDSRVLIGSNASKNNLKKEDLVSRRYVLFATHGILGNEIPYIKEPALVLNLVGNPQEDGFLKASEIFNLNLNADIVGLSACQTGLGVMAPGEGVVGLSRAFMYAGTDSVLVSLWSVSDESTYKLMVRFFEGIKQGKDKLTALKEAKQYLRMNGYDNPFYWAAFILIGEAI